MASVTTIALQLASVMAVVTSCAPTAAAQSCLSYDVGDKAGGAVQASKPVNIVRSFDVVIPTSDLLLEDTAYANARRCNATYAAGKSRLCVPAQPRV